MKRLKYSVLATALMATFIGPLAIQLLASAQSLSIGGNPAYPKPGNARSENIFIHNLKPGATEKDGIRIYNPTKTTRTVNVGAVDSIAAVDGSFSCKQNSEKKTGVGAWVSLSKKQVTLEPGRDEIVDFTITVPESAGPGEQGGCITFQDTKSYAKTSGEGIQLGFRGAVRLAITVPGEIRKELKILRIDTKRNEDGSYMVSPVAKNSGNVSLDVQARVQLRSFFGQKSPILDDAKYPIMPGSTMGWPYRFDRPFWGGFYRAYSSLSYNADPTAGIGERTGDTKKTSRQSGYFFMIPAPGAIAAYIAVVMIPLLSLVIFAHRRRRRFVLSKKWEEYEVREGDSLASIATERGVKWKQLAKVNKLQPPYGLEVGQIIIVPRNKKVKNDETSSATPASGKPASTASANLAQQSQMGAKGIDYEASYRSSPTQPVRAEDIPWPSQEAEYKAWQEERSRYINETPDSRPARTFANPYHGDEDPAEVAERWNGPSSESINQQGAVEDASTVPPMHCMWDDLVDEPKKAVKKPTKKKSTTKKASTTKKKVKKQAKSKDN